MAAVAAAHKEVDDIDHVITSESIAFEFDHQPNFDPQRDEVLAEIEAAAIDTSQVSWWQVSNSSRIYWVFGRLALTWRRRRTGGTLPHRSFAPARGISEGHAPDGERLLQSVWPDVAPPHRILLEDAGYRPVTRLADMLRPDIYELPYAPTAARLEVRPVMPEHYRTVWEADVEPLYDHWDRRLRTRTTYRAVCRQKRQTWPIPTRMESLASQLILLLDQPRLSNSNDPSPVRTTWFISKAEHHACGTGSVSAAVRRGSSGSA